MESGDVMGIFGFFIFAVLMGIMIRRDLRDGRELAESYKHWEAHRHCLPCPYKRR